MERSLSSLASLLIYTLQQILNEGFKEIGVLPTSETVGVDTISTFTTLTTTNHHPLYCLTHLCFQETNPTYLCWTLIFYLEVKELCNDKM